jgi:hypothetical protein
MPISGSFSLAGHQNRIKTIFFLYYYVEEQARRVLPDCSSHPTICLEVGVEIITWITHLEEKKSNLVATHDLFT